MTEARRGRIDKREAILSAAFTVFARDGYAQACVADIAAEAGVAKPTVYNHLTDKATLFRHAVAAEADRQLAADLAILDGLDHPGADLSDTLTEVGRRLLEHYRTDHARALRRLLVAELPRFPELLHTIHDANGSRLHRALADRLARLVVAGQLRHGSVVKAAEQFLALLTGPVEARSALGTRPVPDADLRAVTEAAVHTFLTVNTPGPTRPG